MPKIGMRIIKSAAAVFICFFIYIIRGVGTPFYSAIAAILCMQPGKESTKKVGLNRTIGTLIGGIFGVIVLLIERSLIPNTIPELTYLLISVAIIPLIYTTVLFKQSTASYISCVVFLSITVNHASDVIPYTFAINRIADTLIGIFVAYGLNSIRIPKKKNENTLFVSDLSGTLMNSEDKISSYSKVKLNEMINEEAHITVATDKTPEVINSLIKDINIKLPVITMDGAAIYDFQKERYVYYEGIDYQVSQRVLEVFNKDSVNCFTHTIVNDVMHIYYGDFTNEEEEKFYNEEKLLPLKIYINDNLPKGKEVICFMAIDKLYKIEALYNKFKSCRDSEELKVTYSKYNSNFYTLKVYSIKASRGNALSELKKVIQSDTVVVFGDKDEDISMFQVADVSYAVENSSEDIKKIASEVISDNDSDTVVRTIKKLFYSKALKK